MENLARLDILYFLLVWFGLAFVIGWLVARFIEKGNSDIQDMIKRKR